MNDNDVKTILINQMAIISALIKITTNKDDRKNLNDRLDATERFLDRGYE